VPGAFCGGPAKDECKKKAPYFVPCSLYFSTPPLANLGLVIAKFAKKIWVATKTFLCFPQGKTRGLRRRLVTLL